MLVLINDPKPQTIHLSIGDQTIEVNMTGEVSGLNFNPVQLKLEIVADPNVVFKETGSSNMQLQDTSMTTIQDNYKQNVTFQMLNDPGRATPCAIKLTAVDGSDNPMTSYTHFIYF